MQFTDQEASTIIKGILKGIQYIHSFEIIHRDLKPDNILFRKKNDFSSLKIIDFGLSAKYHYSKFDMLNQQCGTLIYMAPEIIHKSYYAKSVDMWSLGIIMYMLLSGGIHPLYVKGDNPQSYIKKMGNPIFQFGNSFSKLAQHLFTKLCCIDISQRYSATDALNHPWITRKINEIPLTINEVIDREEAEDKAKSLFNLMVLMSFVLHTSGLQLDYKYVDKINIICEKVIEFQKHLFVSLENKALTDEELYLNLTTSPCYDSAIKELKLNKEEKLEDVFIKNDVGFKDFILEEDQSIRINSGTNVIKDSQNIFFKKRINPSLNKNNANNMGQANTLDHNNFFHQNNIMSKLPLSIASSKKIIPPQATHERKGSISLKGEKCASNYKEKWTTSKKMKSNQISLALSNSPNKPYKTNTSSLSKPGSPSKMAQNHKINFKSSNISHMKSIVNSDSKKNIDPKKISPHRSFSKNLINLSGKKE